MVHAPAAGAPVTYCEMGAQFSGLFPILDSLADLENRRGEEEREGEEGRGREVPLFV